MQLPVSIRGGREQNLQVRLGENMYESLRHDCIVREDLEWQR